MRPGLLPKGEREVKEKREEREGETEAEGCCFLDFLDIPVDVSVCKLCARAHTHTLPRSKSSSL